MEDVSVKGNKSTNFVANFYLLHKTVFEIKSVYWCISMGSECRKQSANFDKLKLNCKLFWFFVFVRRVFLLNTAIKQAFFFGIRNRTIFSKVLRYSKTNLASLNSYSKCIFSILQILCHKILTDWGEEEKWMFFFTAIFFLFFI